MAKQKPTSSAVTFHTPVMIPVDEIDYHESNPNQMDDEHLAALIDDIGAEGFDEPLQVIRRGNRYVVIGGEHRLKAVRALNGTSVLAVIKDWTPQEQKIRLVRRNALRGKINPAKLDDLLTSLEQDGIERREALASMLLEARDRPMAGKTRTEAPSINDDDHQDALIEETLKSIVRDLLRKHAQSIRQGYVFFMYEGESHLVVDMTPDLRTAVAEMHDTLRGNRGKAGIFLGNAIREQLKSVETTSGSGEPEY